MVSYKANKTFEMPSKIPRRKRGRRSTNSSVPHEALPRCTYFWVIATEDQFFLQSEIAIHVVTSVLPEKDAHNFLWYCKNAAHEISSYFHKKDTAVAKRLQLSEQTFSKIVEFVYQDREASLQPLSPDEAIWGKISATRLATILKIPKKDFFTHGYKALS